MSAPFYELAIFKGHERPFRIVRDGQTVFTFGRVDKRHALATLRALNERAEETWAKQAGVALK